VSFHQSHAHIFKTHYTPRKQIFVPSLEKANIRFIMFKIMVLEHLRCLSIEGSTGDCEIVYHKSSEM
jgi:hypothetical protein